MAAILAKKLGMTQRFSEGGRVERLTVLEAGPCPVTAIRTEERDGYEAVQLAFGRCREKALSKPELGHLRKANASPHRHLAEFRNEVGELKVFGLEILAFTQARQQQKFVDQRRHSPCL